MQTLFQGHFKNWIFSICYSLCSVSSVKETKVMWLRTMYMCARSDVMRYDAMRCDAMHACMVNVEMCIVHRNILNCRWAKSMSVCRSCMVVYGEAVGRRNGRKVAIVRIKSKFNSIKAGKMLWDNEIVAFPNKPKACDHKTHKTPHWNIHDNVRSCSSLRKNTIQVKRIRNSVLWKWFSLSPSFSLCLFVGFLA